ncbi:MAG: Asp-tRNA(Asn)/Glu-tRNA(Gln) amidotransferase subunit GatA [Oscillatoriales cyanobacterium SM2_2_1]|nr:Asp-tRNA(Asn)/Glu-tRNA(Gln) amidotransferase subunit GatA [Oscillatoriales cyanobacterium SM2_2_1]
MRSISQFRQAFLCGDVSSEEVTAAVLSRLSEREPQVGSFITATPELAHSQAMAADEQLRVLKDSGQPVPPLLGVPLALKDNLCTAGVRTTCGSRTLAQFVPPYESTVTLALRQQGAVVVGKTNLDEFAMGGSTEHSAFHPTRNPWNLARVPGGSSGGSAAAVAAEQCLGALGSDTGGSIRQPASFCGVVGLKPTYGLVSRFGLVAFASSLDQVGPLGHSVQDVALLLTAIAGHDPKDATSLRLAVPDYAQPLGAVEESRPLAGKRIGVIRETMGEGVAASVRGVVEQAIAHFETLGAAVVDISCPRFAYGVPTYYIIAPSEASANLARYDGVKYGLRQPDAKTLLEMYESTREEGFGAEVKRRIMVGTYVLSAGYYDAFYLKAQKVRTLIKEDFVKAFTQVDVLVTPTAPTTAFPLGSKSDPLSMYLLDLMTIPVNLAGLPAISVPCGYDPDGLPIGLQLIAPSLGEARLLHVAHAYEQTTTWHQRRSPLWQS